MRRIAILLLVLGLGSLILPMFHIQFMLVRIFGENETLTGLVMAGIGVVLLALDHFLA